MERPESIQTLYNGLAEMYRVWEVPPVLFLSLSLSLSPSLSLSLSIARARSPSRSRPLSLSLSRPPPCAGMLREFLAVPARCIASSNEAVAEFYQKWWALLMVCPTLMHVCPILLMVYPTLLIVCPT